MISVSRRGGPLRLAISALALATGVSATGQTAPPQSPAQSQAQPQPQSSPTVEDQQLPDNTGLNIPQNLQIFGKLDPNIRKATAIVNESVITQTDVDQRVALLIAANPQAAQISDAERQQLRLQVLRQLIDEVLQIQQAKTADVTITADEIKQSFGSVAKNFNQTPDQFRAYLTKAGSSERSIRRQIEAELAWSRYLRRKVEPSINVGDAEVKAILDRLQADKGTPEFHMAEIYLNATPDRAQQVYANAQQLIAEIQKAKAPFSYFATNFSEATTKVVGGDLGWVRATQLPASLAQASQSMQVGQVAGPIEVPGGFSILYMADKRAVLTADPRDSRLSLKQMTIKFAPGTTEQQASARTADFAKQIQALRGCGSVEKIAAQIGAEVVGNDKISVRDLPAPLQSIMLKLQIGEATPPFGSPTEGVRTLVLCGREDAGPGTLPGADQVQNQLEQQRVNLRAQQTMRDLRRDAIIEYR